MRDVRVRNRDRECWLDDRGRPVLFPVRGFIQEAISIRVKGGARVESDVSLSDARSAPSAKKRSS